MIFQPTAFPEAMVSRELTVPISTRTTTLTAFSAHPDRLGRPVNRAERVHADHQALPDRPVPPRTPFLCRVRWDRREIRGSPVAAVTPALLVLLDYRAVPV